MIDLKNQSWQNNLPNTDEIKKVLQSAGITYIRFQQVVGEEYLIVKFHPAMDEIDAYGVDRLNEKLQDIWDNVHIRIDYPYNKFNEFRITIPLKESFFNITETRRDELMNAHPPTILFGRGTARFTWDWPSCGIGELSFGYSDETKKYECSNEGMGPESVRKLLHAFADHVADNINLED
jgi:hypothetical protein